MTVLRCTAKLLKRMKQPAKPAEPPAQHNPLGEWYADIDFWRRQPFVVMLNATTGATLVLPGNANGLKLLHQNAQWQFALIAGHFGMAGAAVEAELAALGSGFAVAATRDRSLLGSLNNRKVSVWRDLEYFGASFTEAAAREWTGCFSHPALAHKLRPGVDYHQILELVAERLMYGRAVGNGPPRHMH